MSKSRKSRIQRICAIDEVKEEDLYRKGKLLLGIYRDVCWSAGKDAEEVKSSASMSLEHCGYASDEMDRVLVYLETFAKEGERDAFEERVRSLFETRWLINVVEAAVEKVRGFPLYGEIYSAILRSCYMDKKVYSEAELLDMIGLERSSFYRRKKEAITVFGFAIWGLPLLEAHKMIPEERRYEQLAFL